MSERRPPSCCPHPESLVIVEAIPLCRIGGAPDLFEAGAEGPERASAGVARGLPARCAATMSCSEALALMEVIGHVAF